MLFCNNHKFKTSSVVQPNEHEMSLNVEEGVQGHLV